MSKFSLSSRFLKKVKNKNRKTIRILIASILFLLIIAFIILNEIYSYFYINLTDYILITTVIIILWYATETFLLRKEAQRNTLISVKPILVIYNYAVGNLHIGNIGNGPALNIEFRISQFHQSDGYTNLRNFLRSMRDNIYNLKKEEDRHIEADNDLFLDYLSVNKPDFQYGIKNNFAIILIYNDMFGNRYQTVVRVNKVKDNWFVLKQILYGSYKSGELLKFPKHIISS